MLIERGSAVSAPRIVTTSWDDGDPKDLRIAELLRSRGLSGTFYIPIIGYDGRPTLDPGGLRCLVSEGFEVGGHGLSHHTLPQFRAKELAREVGICKQKLQDILGEQVQMFAYPKGRYSARVIRSLKQAGYAGSRTTRMLTHKLNFEPFEMPTTLHAYPHTKSDYLRNLARVANLGGALEYVTRFRRVDSWVELGKRFFDLVLREGGVWHLFGHSWEIEELDLWDDLREVLDYVCRREGVICIPNGDLLRYLRATQAPKEEPKTL